MSLCIGIDTSNYTTSVAVFDGDTGLNVGRLLDVPEGTLGLRQSDALFQHVKRLPEMFTAVEKQCGFSEVVAVAASTKPRWVDGSYMPCFMAGETQGRVLASVLGVPFYECSHQQGHIAAAAWSAEATHLMEQPHLAWHLSGGTTELLLVEPDGVNVKATCVGGTTDISAGQLIDRTGKRLGIPFPAGKELDKLSQSAMDTKSFKVKVSGMEFSLSGIENKVMQLLDGGATQAQVARFTLDTVANVLKRVNCEALTRWPNLPILCSGGVASNSRLRELMPEMIFAPPQYSTDNAMGVAILGHRMNQKG